MAIAVYTSDLTDIFLFETTTGVIAYGGGGAGLAASPDFAMEGTNAVDKQITAADKGLMYGAGAAFTIGADDHFYVWIMVGTPGLMDTRNNRGMHVAIGDDGSNLVKFHVQGSDTYPLGGGDPYVVRFVNTALTNLRTLVGTPGTSPDHIGGGLNTTATVMGSNLGVDAARIGWGYEITGGTSPDAAATWAGLEADDSSTSEGVFTESDSGGFKLQGKVYIGTASTACRFTDSEFSIAFVDTLHALPDFTEILFEHADTEVNWTNGTLKALGTTNPGRIRVLNTGVLGTLTNITFENLGPTLWAPGTTIAGSRWINCAMVDPTNADYGGTMALDGTGDYLDTSAAVSHTFANGDFEIILRGNATDWTTATRRTLFHWDEAGNDSILLECDASDDLSLSVEAGGTTTTLVDTTILDNFTDAIDVWIRVVYDASVASASFYYSNDPKDIAPRDVTWTAGAAPTGTTRTITTLNGSAYLGGDSTPGSNLLTGDLQYFAIWDGTAAGGLQIMQLDMRWGADFTGGPPATRADGIQSVNWREQGNPVYTTGDNRTTTADLSTSDILNSPAASSLFWDVNTDPSGELDGMTFESGGGHAIEFGKNTPASVQLTDQTYTGFNVANGNADSTFYNNTGGALTINVSGASGNTTYLNGVGASTTVVQSVTVTITVSGKGVGVLEGVSVRVEETDGTLISQGSTNASGVYTFSYTGTTPQSVNVVVRDKAWIQQSNPDTIAAGTGLSRSVELQPNPVVNLP